MNRLPRKVINITLLTMVKKRTPTLFLLETLSILLLCASILVLTGCSNFRRVTEVDDWNLLNLLFASSDMPPHWSMVNYGTGKVIDPYRRSDAAGIGFLSDLYPESFGVSEEVYRFHTTKSAQSDFEAEKNILTQLISAAPDEWRFQSQTADESYFVCTEYPNITSCTWLVRYDRIVVEFRAALIADRFRLSDMEHLARIIDEKASKIVDVKN